MQSRETTDEFLRRICDPLTAGYKAPDVSRIKARHLVKPLKSQQSDIFSMIAAFLNFKIKLLHALIAFAVIWGGVLLYSDEKTPQTESLSVSTYATNVAAVYEATVPACIKTYVLKK